MTNGMGKHHPIQVQDQSSTASEQTMAANRRQDAAMTEKKAPDVKQNTSADNAAS